MCLRWIPTCGDMTLDVKLLIVNFHKFYSCEKIRKTTLVSGNQFTAHTCCASGMKKSMLSKILE